MINYYKNNMFIEKFYIFLSKFKLFFKYYFSLNIKCEIETPQFLGCQEKYYMFKQTGRYNVFNKKFTTDNSVEGSHNVWYRNNKDFEKSVIKYL